MAVSNQKLQESIKVVEGDIKIVARKQSNFEKFVRGEFKEFVPKVNTMHDFITDQEGYQRGRREAKETADKRSGAISISPEVWNIIKWLVAAVVIFSGYKVVL